MVSVNAELSELLADDTLQFDTWLGHLPISFNEADQALLKRAWDTARQQYGDERRPSGETYFTHALTVASLIAELRLDAETLAAAVLHDLPPLERFDAKALESDFGIDVVNLIGGVSRMEVINALHDNAEAVMPESEHAEALRKMLLAMAQDVRVVFIILAERLDDMRNLKHRSLAEQEAFARETQDLYAPLANRLGLWRLKWELEDLCFRYLEPGTYKHIARMLAERRVDRERYIAEVNQQLRDALQKAGIEAEVNGRPKHLFSIWRKMQRKGSGIDGLFDIRALRVMVKDVATCYAVLGVVHSLWRHIPKEFDDYIATPKENNYRSLHTAVVGPEGKTLEVQIRTYEMHQQAELGIAAHWRYKEGGSQDQSYEQKIAWLRQILEWGQEEDGAEDFISRFKAEIFEDRVYVISPRGDVIDLPRGATPLDFAYHVHSDIGHRCRGAKVNGRIVPLTYELKNGEQVEILTARHSKPSRDWLSPGAGYLRSSRARSKVKAWFRQQDQELNVTAGRHALDRELHRLGVQDVSLERLAQKSRFPKVEDFLAAIGRNDITSSQIANLLTDQILPKPDVSLEVIPTGTPSSDKKRSGASDDVTIYGVGNLLTRLARCCKPAPGDPIVGFITRGQGVTIHRRDCRNLSRLSESEGERLIEVSWTRPGDKAYPVDIEVDAVDRQGLLRDVSAVLSNEKINVLGVNTRTDPRDHRARMTLTMEIRDVAQMSRIMHRIASLRNVLDVRRRT
ncbi:GTP diphosphokinase [Alkalilimnicola ehrlichii]|uniref:GTP pyrophosphokinase n=2 Tax=Alkalilimnicola ehrlichii TaxID=351052 RepID=A0A3E0WNU6_9GAMM|nr:GTP diphosphokinase [Alkalilimnicola ehrlichii]RFA33821.1 GTP diphosphokinase [Alkalilimnicola ehrlichii]